MLNREIFFILVCLLFLAPACTVKNRNQVENNRNAVLKERDTVSYWFDKETDTVHRIDVENGKEKVVSIIKYREGRVLEVMKVLQSSSVDGKLMWIYFVPSTKYIVNIVAIRNSENKKFVEWSNRSFDGEEKSGTDVFLRCEESGISENLSR